MADAPASRGRPRHARTWSIRRFAELDSTNRWLLDEARGGAPDGLVVVADHQTAGRGRRGRTWVAPPGSSLLVSVLVRPAVDGEGADGEMVDSEGVDGETFDGARAQLVTMAAGLALADAVMTAAGVQASLKWPNDLVVGDRKLAGLLAEADVSADGQVWAIVIGAGCNVDWPDVPAELAEIATACNLEAGRPVGRDVVLDAFLDGLGARLASLDDVADEYRTRLSTLGRRVRVDLGDRAVVGLATDLDPTGALVVTPDGGAPLTIAAGDVVHLRTT
jgi:BirA family biotin operon repressor/biotin-[acetyl-CoA-carboxylase] ligase